MTTQLQRSVPAPLWVPPEETVANARVSAFTAHAEWVSGRRLSAYEDLWEWSTTDIETFWESVWEYFDIRSRTPYTSVLSERRMPGAHWFSGATVNYVDQVFRHATPDRPAIVFRSEDGRQAELSWA